ncbi:mucin-7-like [Ixodes scapularis]
MLAIAAFFTLVVVLGISLLRWRQRHFSYFKDLGIAGPKPNLLWGNLWQYHEKGLFRALDKWCNEYGDIFGFYNGDVPMLVVQDLEFLKYVFVKNFSNFTDRGVTMRTDEMHPILGRSVIHARGSGWKSIRSCVTPGFSTLKLKLHLGGTNFQVVVNTRAAALKLREAGSVSIANQSVSVVPTGPEVTNVTCLFLPTFVSNDQLVQALAPYGKVIDVSYATYHRTATVKTGTRFIRIEMKEANPLPNFLRVAGHRATFDYRGLKRVCRHCRQEGNVRAQCTTGYWDHCGVFGHPTEGCTANCRRCGGTYATVDSRAKRSYSSMVAGNYATDFLALDPGNATSPIAPEAPAVPPVFTVAPP